MDVVAFLIMAIVLIGLAFWDIRPWRERAKKATEPAPMDTIREAAFDVIAASLEAEPNNWQPVYGEANKVIWLSNNESRTALWMADGHMQLFVFKEKSSIKLYPPPRMRAKLYTLASGIIRGINEQKEMANLREMVSAFDKAMESRRRNLDTGS